MKGILIFQNKVALTLLIVLSFLVLKSCKEPDPFPNEPQIQFNNIQFIEIQENGNPDSLILYFDFQDGDGDLGLEGFETQAPFQDYNFYYDANNQPITFNQTTVALPISIYNPVSNSFIEINEDNRPSYDCINYQILYMNYSERTYLPPGVTPDDSDQNVYELDTIFLEKNRFRNNIEVKYFVKRGPNNYEELDWRYRASELGCGISFDGRFPILDYESVNESSSLEGTIKYAMVSSGFRIVLRKDTFNIKFRIMDRSLNISEFAETGDITLDQLIR